MHKAFAVFALVSCFGCSNTNTMKCDGGELTLTVTAPDCLAAPNHKMVLFELGKDVDVEVTGSCTTPTLAITNVTSNQPALGGGQGNASPDIMVGNSSVCLRSERQGTSADDRVYTITVQATDGVTTVSQDVKVRVQHDSSGGKCPNVDPSRIVSDDDTRCHAL